MRRFATALLGIFLLVGLLHGQTSVVDCSVKLECGRASGSGVVVKNGQKYYIWTALHVIKESPQAIVTFPSQIICRANVVKVSSVNSDLAVLEITDKGDYPCTSLGEVPPVRGDEVWSIGYPKGQGPVTRKGYVVENVGNSGVGLVVSTIAISGDSGGGIFSKDGKVVGILTATANNDPQQKGRCAPLQEILALNGSTQAQCPTCPGGVCNPFPRLPPSQGYANPYPYVPSFPPSVPPTVTTLPPGVPPSVSKSEISVLIVKIEEMQKQIERIQSVPGPKGDRGVAGPEGKQGDKGEPGPTGPVGTDGRNGKEGERGYPGTQGPKGDSGDKGEKGADGKNGVDGKNGKDADMTEVELLKKRLQALEDALKAGGSVRIQVSPKP